MFTIPMIAAYLGVTPGYVRQLIAKHKIPPAGHIGRAHLYRVTDITRHTGHGDRVGASR